MVKFWGVALGIGIVIVGIWLASKAESVTPGVMGAVVGAFLGGQMYFVGILICAQGQLLMASLDTAVNSCEYLSRSERSQIMGLGVGTYSG
jgi:hypothetical protein